MTTRRSRSRALLLAAVALTLAAAGCEAAPPTEEAVSPPASPPGEQAASPPAEPEPEPEPAPTPSPAPAETEAFAPVGAFGVSAGHPDAVEVGMEVLAGGGNAVDAAIATAYAVSVVEPFASGVGGGGAAIVVEPGAEPVAYDYREVVAQDGRIPSTNTGIPGFVAGMEALHEAHGTGDLGTLLEGAITLARDGVPASGIVADQLRSAGHRLPSGDLPHLFPGGSALRAGDALVQEELASTLERLAGGGAREFYDGGLAEALANRVDGIDTASLAAYETRVRPPRPVRSRASTCSPRRRHCRG